MIKRSFFQEFIIQEKYEVIFSFFEQESSENLLILLFDTKLFDFNKKTSQSISFSEKQRIEERFWIKFWEEYFLSSKHGSSFINEGFRLLAHYFSFNKSINIFFIQLLLEKFSEATIKALRISRKFLKYDFSALEEQDVFNTNTYVRQHLLAFKLLKQKENKLWETTLFKTQKQSLNVPQWLYIIFLHHAWQMQKFKNEKDYLIDHFVNDFNLLQTYSVFLSFLFSNKNEIEDWTKVYIVRSITELLNKPDKLYISFEVISSWLIWYSFVYDQLNVYCFNLNYEVEIININQVRFYPKNIINQSIRHASIIRFSMFMDMIRNISSSILIESIKHSDGSKEKVWEKDLSDSNVFFEKFAFLSNYSEASLLAHVFCLDANAENQLDEYLQLLSSIQSQAQSNFLTKINSIEDEHFEDWFMNIHKLIGSFLNEGLKENKPVLPIFLFSLNFIDSILKKFKGTNITSSIFSSLLIHDLNNKHRPFNKFHPYFNWYETPLIKKGDVIIALKSILGAQNSGILALETVMKSAIKRSEEQKSETQLFEFRTAELFRNAGFEKLYLNSKIRSKDGINEGEIDLLVIEKSEVLLIEIKRSQVPLTQYELFQEEEIVLPKAAKQLQNIKKILSSGMDFELELVLNKTKSKIDRRSIFPEGEFNIYGCILSMYPFKDSEKYGEWLYKTSFVELALSDILTKCKKAKDNKIKTFMHEISMPYIPVEYLQSPKLNYEFILL